MNVTQVTSWFNSNTYNPYNNAASAGPTQGVNPASVSPYGADTAFYDTSRPATVDGAITKMFVGGLTGYKYSKGAAGAGSTQFLMNSAGIGAAISGTISIIKNVASMSHGRQTASTTVSNVLTDTLQGGVSALGGGIGAMGTNKILTALGATAGTPLMLATVIGGAIGAVATNQILNTEKLRSVF